MEIQPNHVHVLVKLKHNLDPSKAVQYMKGYSSRMLWLLEPEKLREELKKLQERGKLELYFQKIYLYDDLITYSPLYPQIYCMSEFADQIRLYPEFGSGFISLLGIFEKIMGTVDDHQRVHILQNLIRQGPGLVFGASILSHNESNRDDKEDKLIFPPPYNIDEYKKDWLKRVKKEAEAKTLDTHRHLLQILTRWKKLDPEGLTDYLEEFMTYQRRPIDLLKAGTSRLLREDSKGHVLTESIEFNVDWYKDLVTIDKLKTLVNTMDKGKLSDIEREIVKKAQEVLFKTRRVSSTENLNNN